MPRPRAHSSIVHVAFAALIALSGSSSARADDFASAPVAGAGGASIAHPSDNGVIRTNPAAVSLRKRYDIQGLFRYGPAPGMYWSVSAIDARTNDFIQFGLVYDGAITSPPFLPEELPGFAVTGVEPSNRKERHDITFALSVPFLERKISVGVNGTVMIFDNAWNGKGTTGNLDVGLAASPIEQLSIGLVGRDLIPVANQFDRPATLAFGMRGGEEDIAVGSIEVDHRFEHAQGLPWDVRAGIEGSFKFMKLRGGWNWDGEQDLHRITAGLGANSASGSIDYAFQVPLNDPDVIFNDVIHTLTLTIKIKTPRSDENEDSPIRWEDGS